MEIFWKKLSKTDIKKRCVVPMRCFNKKSFPKPKEGSHMVEFVVKDESGHDWKLCCSKRNVGKDLHHPKHPKPVLIKEWVPFVESKELCVGDRVSIYKEQDETGSKHLRIKVVKSASPPEACRSPVKNQNLHGNSEAPAIFQHLSFGVPSHDLGGNTAVKTSSINKEQIPFHCGTSQHIACYKTEMPSQSLSLELTLKPTMTGGTAAATNSVLDREQKPTVKSNSQHIAINNTDTPGLSMSLGLTPKPTMTRVQQHAYMQETEPKTIDFLRSFDEA